MLRNDELTNELETIRLADSKKRLRPEAVVEAAKSPSSRLHDYFDWDDEVAGEKWRKAQARTLIRVAVFTPPGSNEEYRMYCNLTSDRQVDDDGTTGGYRSTVEVMGDEQLCAILMADALREMRTFEAKYAKLEGLAPILEAYRTMIAEEEPANRRRKKTRRATKASKKAKKKAKKKARSR